MSTIALSCAALGVLLSARCNVFVFSPVIAQLERAAAFERRSGQSDSEEVMSSPTPYRNVTMFPGGSLHTRQIRRNASEEVTSSPTPYRNVTTVDRPQRP